MKILLCEDDSNIATVARLALEKIGQHEVVWVKDGEQSYNTALKENFDLILLDDMMPKMSGADVCIALKAANKKVAPIIFISANSQEQRVAEFQPMTIGYIAKPFDPITLSQQLQAIFGSAHKKAV